MKLKSYEKIQTEISNMDFPIRVKFRHKLIWESNPLQLRLHLRHEHARVQFCILLFLASRRRSLEIDMIAARGGGRAGATTMAVTGVGRRETSKDDDSRVKKGLCFVWTMNE